MPNLDDSEFPDLIEPYLERFGHTFSPMMVPSERVNYLVDQMKKALAGNRGPITDEELEVDIPDGAAS